MYFGQLIERLRKQVFTKNTNKRIKNQPGGLHEKGINEHLSVHKRSNSTNKENGKLISSLNQIAQLYRVKSFDIPLEKTSRTDSEIIQLVRQESRLARANGLPRLSLELIEKTLGAGHKSPWLLHDKALTISMMGRKKEALRILKSLQKNNKGEKISNSIASNIKKSEISDSQSQAKIRKYMLKEAGLMALNNNIESEFPANIVETSSKANVKSFVFKRARACLDKDPLATLSFCNLILDYFPGDLACLQLKGEAFSTLSRGSEAIAIWKDLAHSSNKKVALKASELISESFSEEMNQISSTQSPKFALEFFIQQHLKLNLVPTLTKDSAKILRQIQSPNVNQAQQEISNQQLQILLNSIVIRQIENYFCKGECLDAAALAQKSGAIRKTAPKAG